MQTFYAEIGYKISRYAQMCNNSLYKKRNLEKETNLEEAPIGKLDMNKFAPLADLGEDNDKSEKEPIEKFLFQQNKWKNSHVSQSDSYTFTSQMGENRRRKSNHQKANTSARQINRQNKFASLNSEDSSSNSGNFSHYQEQPHRKEQNTHRTDHRKPDKVDYSAISEASEALQSLIQSCSSSMKKPFKQNNQSFRSQKQTEHNKKNKQNNQSNTEQGSRTPVFPLSNGLNPSFMPTQQRPSRALTESLDQFHLIRQLTFQKLFLDSHFLFARYFLRLAREVVPLYWHCLVVVAFDALVHQLDQVPVVLLSLYIYK
ncbi:Hypothetical_protein [Hexamita inflata]|uniref:Hypothetical_protein n=1 Tax=Hexamita inflata TaxID=28002 RepID=A0AA86U0D5_9EUKA|nr:Hypothetical protein HINF_LOCUS24615 [Hexamita inflata]